MYTLEAKDTMKTSTYKTKRLSSHKFVGVYSDSGVSPKVLLKKKYRTGVLTVHKKNIKSKTPNNGVTQRNCVLYKKDGIPEHNYMSHSDDTWFGKRYEQKSLKKGLGGNLGNIYAAVNNPKKYNKKVEKE